MSLKIYLVGTPFPLNFLCGNAVPMRSRPTTRLRCYKIEQLKLHRSLLGVKGGGGQKQSPEQPSLQQYKGYIYI